MNHKETKESGRRQECSPVFLLEAKADGDRLKVSGYAAVFGVVDRGDDVIEAGAFAASLAEMKASGNGPAFLWQHEPSKPVGIWTEIKEDQRGLFVRGEILADVAQGAEAIALLRADALSGLSIGYRTRESDFDEVTGIRRLKKVDLWEVSLVTFPMQTDARLDAVTDAGGLAAAQITRITENALVRDAGVSRKEARDAAGAACDRIMARRDAGDLDLSEIRGALANWRG